MLCKVRTGTSGYAIIQEHICDHIYICMVILNTLQVGGNLRYAVKYVQFYNFQIVIGTCYINCILIFRA